MRAFCFQHTTAIAVASVLWIIVGASLLSHGWDGRRTKPKERRLRGGSAASVRGGSRTRGLVGVNPTAFQAVTAAIGEAVVRQGTCSAGVPYADLAWDPEWDSTNKTFLDGKSVQEVLVHLDQPVYATPPNKYGADGLGPVIVDIGLFINGISEVDTGYNSFFMEGFLDLVWCDGRLAFDPKQAYNSKHVYLETDAAKELEKIWWPDITFVNEIGKRTTENQELIIEADGTVEYRERFAIHLNSDFETQDFPFDRQTLTVEVESFAWNRDIVQFFMEEDLLGFDESFDIPGFEKTGIRADIVEKREVRDRDPFSELIVEFDIQRDSKYYATKVLIPLTMIVMVSWAVFWMDGRELGDRTAISFTGILTAVAYQFIIIEQLPDHIYDTFLNNFIIVSFFNLVLTIIINVVVHKGHKHGFSEEAKKVDIICRVLFPVMFLFGCLMIAGPVWSNGSAGMVLTLVASIVMLIAVGFLVIYFVRQERKALANRRGSTESSKSEKRSLAQDNDVVMFEGDGFFETESGVRE